MIKIFKGFIFFLICIANVFGNQFSDKQQSFQNENDCDFSLEVQSTPLYTSNRLLPFKTTINFDRGGFSVEYSDYKNLPRQDPSANISQNQTYLYFTEPFQELLNGTVLLDFYNFFILFRSCTNIKISKGSEIDKVNKAYLLGSLIIEGNFPVSNMVVFYSKEDLFGIAKNIFEQYRKNEIKLRKEKISQIIFAGFAKVKGDQFINSKVNVSYINQVIKLQMGVFTLPEEELNKFKECLIKHLESNITYLNSLIKTQNCSFHLSEEELNKFNDCFIEDYQKSLEVLLM